MSEWSQGLTRTQDVNWGSSSVPHFLQMGLLLIPIACKFHLRMIFPGRRPITALNFVLLKDNNRVFIARLGPEINSRACLCVVQGLRHNIKYWLSIQRFIFLLTFCLDTPKKGSGPTKFWTEPSPASLLAISFPLTSACPGTQYSLTILSLRMPVFVLCLVFLDTSRLTARPP